MIKIISSKESQQGVISLRRSSSLIGKPNRHLEEVQGCRKSRAPKATAEGRGRTQPENKGSPAREEGGAVPIREEGGLYSHWSFASSSWRARGNTCWAPTASSSVCR